MYEHSVHILVVTSDLTPWKDRLQEKYGVTLQLDVSSPDVELVLQELAIDHFPVIVLAENRVHFGDDFLHRAIPFAPGSTIITNSKLGYDHREEFPNGCAIQSFVPNQPIDIWLEAIDEAVARWHRRTEVDDEAATVERLSHFFHAVFDGLPQGVALFNSSCRVVFCNKSLSEQLGLPRSELLNLHCSNFCERFGSDEDACIVASTYESGISQRIKIHLNGVAGSNKILELSTERIITGSNEYHVLLVCNDVSTRVALEQQVSLQNDFLERLLLQAPIGIVATDTNFIIQTCNNRFLDRFGFGRNISPGQSLLDHPLNNDGRLTSYLRRALESKEQLPPVQISITGRKEMLYLIIGAGTIRNSLDETEGLVITIEDSTEEHKLLFEIADKEEDRIRRIAELQMLGEVSRALHSAKELDEVLYLILVAVTSDMGIGFNRAFYLLLDQDVGELTGRLAIGPGNIDEANMIWGELEQKHLSFQELFANWRTQIGADRTVNEMVSQLRISLKSTDSFISRAVIDKKPTIIHRQNSHQDPVWSILNSDECAVIPMLSKERVEGVLLVDNAINRNAIQLQQLDQLERFADMAATAILHARWYKQLEQRFIELRSANAELRENRDKLIKSERLSTIGEITATVAHEIRNPLAAIGGLAQVIRDDLGVEHPSVGYVTMIVDEIRRLERIVNETLDFARPVRANFERKSLVSIIRGSLRMMSGELDPEQYYVQTYFDPDGEWVVLDEDQIRQVLFNLLKNSVHAMPGGGIIVITTKRTVKEIQVDVRDYGKGIPEAVAHKIFEPFFTTKTSGSGIGLSVSRQILKQHGGSLNRIPVDGPGALFRLTFPASDQGGEV